MFSPGQFGQCSTCFLSTRGWTSRKYSRCPFRTIIHNQRVASPHNGTRVYALGRMKPERTGMAEKECNVAECRDQVLPTVNTNPHLPAQHIQDFTNASTNHEKIFGLQNSLKKTLLGHIFLRPAVDEILKESSTSISLSHSSATKDEEKKTLKPFNLVWTWFIYRAIPMTHF